jgi:lysophospholipase L1-like esterase
MFCLTSMMAMAVECPSWEANIATTAIPPQSSAPAKQANEQIENAPTSIDVLLIGDSLVQAMPTQRLATLLVGKSMYNFGIRQDKTQNVIWRLQQLKGRIRSVETIVLWIGSNNVQAGDSACAIEAGFDEILNITRSYWPNAQLIALPILPRGADFSTGDKQRLITNAALRVKLSSDLLKIEDRDITCGQYGNKLAKGVLQCDVSKWLTCENFLPDNTHLTDSGYDKVFLSIASAVN